ncbi:MAG TPA: response regulator [Methanoregula sp.]|nr:response regulator [Methanoregula sp.]
MDRATFLIVEDEPEVAETLEIKLKKFGYTVVGRVSSAEDAIIKAGDLHPDIVLMDIELSGKMDGIQAADAIRKKYHIPIIYITAICDMKTLERVGSSVPYGYILKPFKDDELHTVIEIALDIIAKKV